MPERLTTILTMLVLVMLLVILVEMFRYYQSYVDWIKSAPDQYAIVPRKAKQLLSGTIYITVISYGYDLLTIIIITAVLWANDFFRRVITLVVSWVYLFVWLGYALAIQIIVKNLSPDDRDNWNNVEEISSFLQAFTIISMYRAVPFAVMIYRDVLPPYCNL